MAGQKRAAAAAEIPIDSPLRYRRTGYVFSLPPADEPAPPPLPLSVDAVLAEAAERRARKAAAEELEGAEEGGASEQAAAAAEPRLVDAASGEVISLPRGKKITLGRNGSCDVVVGERHVSGKHCVLHCDKDGAVQVEDVSSNNTYVNGAPVLKGRRTHLGHNDKVALTRRGIGWVYHSAGC